MNVGALADFESHRIEGFAHQGGRQFDVPLFSHIAGNLWVGGCPVDRAPQEFKFIISLYPWGEYKTAGHQVTTYAYLFDSSDEPFDEPLLRVLARHVIECKSIAPTLVHCQAGLNRSNLVAALALIEEGTSPVDAIALLRDRRSSVVLCNRSFESWLLRREPPAKGRR